MTIKFVTLFFLPLIIFTSCIQDEPKYREADVLTFRVDDSIYVESVIKENGILLVVEDDADIQKITPHFTISPGAVAIPASGETLDFTNDQYYIIQSEDGNYEKRYRVRVVTHASQVSLKYNFDKWYTDPTNSNIHFLADPLWDDANSGVKIASIFLGINQFPTDYTDDCVAGGKAVLLRTIKGGKIIFVGNIPIFAGSLLRGKFEANMDDPLKSLYLGQKFPRGNGKPTHFTGYYKYYPGPEFTDKNGKPVEGKTDEMSMYAAIFKVPKGIEGDEAYLDGYTIHTSPDVIARAEWSEGGKGIVETPAINNYKHFSIPFVYKEDFDYHNYNYKLTMVFSSSKNGDLYEGAVGSELYIDEVEVVTEDF